MLVRFTAFWLFLPLAFGQDTGAVFGTTFDKLTKTPLPEVLVQLTTTTWPPRPLYSGVSDAAGSFRIDGVAPGEYRVEVKSSRA